MREELVTAIVAGDVWVKRFLRREYEKAFREYSQRFGDCYLEAVRTAGEDLMPLVDELLDGVEAAIVRQRFWNRSAARANAKWTVVQYLSPMLLGMEGECPRLATVLRDGWAVRWPRDAYQTASYQTLKSGFKNVILGIEIPDKHKEEQES